MGFPHYSWIKTPYQQKANKATMVPTEVRKFPCSKWSILGVSNLMLRSVVMLNVPWCSPTIVWCGDIVTPNFEWRTKQCYCTFLQNSGRKTLPRYCHELYFNWTKLQEYPLFIFVSLCLSRKIVEFSQVWVFKGFYQSWVSGMCFWSWTLPLLFEGCDVARHYLPGCSVCSIFGKARDTNEGKSSQTIEIYHADDINPSLLSVFDAGVWRSQSFNCIRKIDKYDQRCLNCFCKT